MDTNYDYVYVGYCQSPGVLKFQCDGFSLMGGFASSSTCRNWVSTLTVRAYMGVLARVKLNQLRDSWLKATCQGVCPRLCALWWRDHRCIGSITSQRSCGPSQLSLWTWTEGSILGTTSSIRSISTYISQGLCVALGGDDSILILISFSEVFMCPRGAQTSQYTSDQVFSLLIWVAEIAFEGLQIMIVIVGVTNGHQEWVRGLVSWLRILVKKLWRWGLMGGMRCEESRLNL